MAKTGADAVTNAGGVRVNCDAENAGSEWANASSVMEPRKYGIPSLWRARRNRTALSLSELSFSILIGMSRY